MILQEFYDGMEQILVYFRRPRSVDEEADFKLYMEALFGQLHWMRGDLFKKAAFALAGELDKKDGKPEAMRFKAAYAKLEEAERVSQVFARAADPPKTPAERRAEMLAMAKNLDHRGAVSALAFAERIGTVLPDEVRAVLEEKVGNVALQALRPAQQNDSAPKSSNNSCKLE